MNAKLGSWSTVEHCHFLRHRNRGLIAVTLYTCVLGFTLKTLNDFLPSSIICRSAAARRKCDQRSEDEEGADVGENE